MLLALALAPSATAKEVRDAIGSFENTATSEHFVVKWGDEPPDDEDLDGLLAALESAWDVEVDELGWAGTLGWESYYVNIYLGNTGGDSPDISFPGGFARVDDEGYPYAVVNPVIVALFSGDDPYDVGAADPAGYATDLVAHEFFHTLQLTTGAYRAGYSGMTIKDENQWAWESGADWASQLVSGSESGSWSDSLAYFVEPYHSLTAEGDTTDDTPYGAMKIYGEWAWWGYLDEVLDDRSIIHDLWAAGTNGDSAADCAALLDERGYDFPTLFLDFAAHNTAWDYSWGPFVAKVYRQNINEYLGHRVVATWDAGGTGGWQDNDPAIGLHRLSYNAVELWNPGAGTWHVAVEADDPSVLATVVIETADAPRYVSLAGLEGEVETVDGDASLYLVVAAPTLDGTDAHALPYRYEIDPIEADPAPDSGGCGCAATPGAAGLAALLALVPLTWRRRR